MKIIVDVDPAGHPHFIDTDPANYPLCGDPLDPSKMVPVITVLQHMNGRVDLQQKGGWLEMNQLPGEDVPKSRWQRLVDTINAGPADAPERQLGLK